MAVGRRRLAWFTLAVGLSGAILLGLLFRVSLSAVDEPGRFETWMATRAKRWMIGRAARAVPASVSALPQAAAIGQMRFVGLCAPCHGMDGRSPTEIGRGMLPRAVDLGAPEVQAWSDAELFWIVKHGIRFTGMPGFGTALDDDEMGALVAYVRTLGRESAGSVDAPDARSTR